MAKRKTPEDQPAPSKDIQEAARNFLSEGCAFLDDQLKKLMNDFADFEKKRGHVQGRIRDGAKRTRGRIV
jgi:hypothetical protein